jgi:phosphohistidine phosphatase
MHVYILRHGNAGDPANWAGDDSQRPLTEEGRKEMRAVAKGIDWLDLKLDTLITSPLVRARETADFVRQAVHPPHFITSDLLAPGCDLEALSKLMATHAEARELMIVGHEPDMSGLICELIGASATGVQMKKAACCCIRLDTSGGSAPRPGSGVLVWHLPPRILTRLG